MRTFLVWIGAVLITLVIISPFFWLWFVKKKNKWLYVAVSSVAFLIIYYFYIFGGSDLILDLFAKRNTSIYYFYDDVESTSIPFIPFLTIISPFILTRVLYGKITIKSFFISLLLSILIFVALTLIFAYYIFPKAAEGFLINI